MVNTTWSDAHNGQSPFNEVRHIRPKEHVMPPNLDTVASIPPILSKPKAQDTIIDIEQESRPPALKREAANPPTRRNTASRQATTLIGS